MIRLPAALLSNGLTARLILQVHDELMLECPREELDAAVKIVQDIMENAYTLSIPLETEARFGDNWGSMQKFK